MKEKEDLPSLLIHSMMLMTMKMMTIACKHLKREMKRVSFVYARQKRNKPVRGRLLDEEEEDDEEEEEEGALLRGVGIT